MSRASIQENSRAPFFVIGSPRSGTTLLRLILASHSALAVPPECGFIVWLHPLFGGWGATEFADTAAVAQFADAVVASRKFETWGLSRSDVKTTIVAGKPSNFAQACDLIYQCFCSRAGKDSANWGDKNNYYLNHISLLAALFPKARFLHIVRDGRDVACSYRTTMAIESNSPYRPDLPVDINGIANRWVQDIRISRSQIAKLAAGRAFEVRYEDLVSDPATVVRGLCDKLGCGFEQQMLEFHLENRKNQLEPPATMDWKQRTLEPIGPSSVGRFHTQLRESEIRDFVDIAQHELRLYRYID